MGYRGPQWASSEPQGIVAPEPYREPPVPPPRRYPVHVNPGDTEMSFGPGLVAPQYNGRPPSEGGIYMPKCPPVHENGKQKPIRRQARGYPGEQVAR